MTDMAWRRADLVLAEDLQEVQVAEFAGGGLGQAGVEGLEHAGQLQGAQALARAAGMVAGTLG